MAKDVLINDVPTMGAQDAPEAVYDATTLGVPKMVVFGFQHMFAMFGATILVPILTGFRCPLRCLWLAWARCFST